MAEKIVKITKKDNYAELRNIVLANIGEDSPLIAFIDHEVELLERKASKGNSAKTAEHNEIIEKIKDVLFDNIGKPMRVSEMLKTPTLAEYTSQRISSMLSKMVESGDVTRTVDKKVTYFSIN